MIDWAFITGLESCQLKGYVPPSGDSGVTIATGVDLGQRAAAELNPLPQGLRERLYPYLGLKTALAAQVLQRAPLTVSQGEAGLIDGVARDAITRPLVLHYQASAGAPFEGLPDAAQTVIASVGYQYGAIWLRCPKFWGVCIAKDWPGAATELRAFGDAYPTRRNREADYLEQHLKGA